MKVLSRIWFPAAVLVFASAGAMDFGSPRLTAGAGQEPYAVGDTVVYEPYAYRSEAPDDSALLELSDSLIVEEEEVFGDVADTAGGRLSPRDSLKALLDTSLWDKIDSIYLAHGTPPSAPRSAASTTPSSG